MLSPAEAEKYGDSLYFTYWFNTDFLCRCKSCLGQDYKSCKYASSRNIRCGCSIYPLGIMSYSDSLKDQDPASAEVQDQVKKL